MAVESLDKFQIEELHTCVRKALGIAVILSEEARGDRHDAYAAGAIVDNLHEARKILERTTEEASHG